MTDLTRQEVLLGIQCGIFDDNFDEILDAIKRRRRALAANQLSQLMVGDHFKITNITPKSLIGVKAEVADFKGNSVEIVLLEAVPASGRARCFRYGQVITIPSACIGEKVA